MPDCPSRPVHLWGRTADRSSKSSATLKILRMGDMMNTEHNRGLDRSFSIFIIMAFTIAYKEEE